MMADLFERVIEDDGDIAIHTFYAALVDYADGGITRNQIIAGFSLDASATTDLDAILTAIDGETGVVNKLRWGEVFHAVALLAVTGQIYNTKASFKTRLGL